MLQKDNVVTIRTLTAAIRVENFEKTVSATNHALQKTAAWFE